MCSLWCNIRVGNNVPGSSLFHLLAPAYHNVVVFVRMRTDILIYVPGIYMCTCYILLYGTAIITWYHVRDSGKAMRCVFTSVFWGKVIVPGW